ncbi:hypothetical protein JCM18920_554 [Cutibacterium acnes JCM 18920]|nr:hypothetical protein JCM18920_554 [Cutibacterium acnes JCM 18920]
MESRGVDDDDLRFLVSDYATDDVTGGLRLRRGNGDLGTNQALVRVDLPAFGRPTKQTNPEWNPARVDSATLRSHSQRRKYPRHRHP